MDLGTLARWRMHSLRLWGSLAATEANQARARADLSELDLDGRTYVNAGEPPPPREGHIDLVQAYDECS
jgi:hypothetical protein